MKYTPRGTLIASGGRGVELGVLFLMREVQDVNWASKYVCDGATMGASVRSGLGSGLGGAAFRRAGASGLWEERAGGRAARN